MDFSNPWGLMSGIIIGLVGFTIFVRGKREASIAQMAGGVAMCVYPYFVTNLVLVWLGFAACLAGMWWLSRFE